MSYRPQDATGWQGTRERKGTLCARTYTRQMDRPCCMVPGDRRCARRRAGGHRVAAVVILFAAVLVAACQEDGRVQVRNIDFQGVVAVSEDQLRNALATKESSWIPWGRKQYFDRKQFDADLQRIRAFYADRGYPDASVTAFDVQLNDDQTQVDVVLTIEEGEPVRIAGIDMHGFWDVPPDQIAAIQNSLPFKVGDVRNRQLMVTAQRGVENALRDYSFAYARAWVTETEKSPRSLVVDVTADPGPSVDFGLVEISGNRSVGERVISRELLYRSGDPFSRSAMQDSQRRLYGLELFQFANVEVLDPERQFPEIRTRVTVAENRHQHVNFGLGYGTDEKARVEAEYRHVNFLGDARTASVRGKWSSLDRGVQANFIQPYFLVRGITANLQGQQWKTFTPAYDAYVAGGRAIFEHRVRSQRRTIGLSFIAEQNRSTVSEEALNDPTLIDELIALGLDPVTGKQEGFLGAVAGDFQIDGTDNILDAHRGFQAAAHIEHTGRIIPGTFKYYAVSTDLRHYLPIGPRLTFANRLAWGVIDGEGDEDTTIPFGKRLFLGGANSVRGWGRYEISPLSESGVPLGGDSLFGFSSEIRLELNDKLGAVAFLDAGNVWASPWTLNLADLRYAVGPGVRYLTPVGPIRFDVGIQLNPIPNLQIDGEKQQRRWRMHFSIGQAF
jgi:outer membrane protein insertion porin family